MAAWAICGLVFVAGLMAQGSVLQPIVLASCINWRPDCKPQHGCRRSRTIGSSKFEELKSVKLWLAVYGIGAFNWLTNL